MAPHIVLGTHHRSQYIMFIGAIQRLVQVSSKVADVKDIVLNHGGTDDL